MQLDQVRIFLFAGMLSAGVLSVEGQITYPYQFVYEGNPLVRHHGAADPDVHVWDDTVWVYCSQDRIPFPGQPQYDAMDGYHVFSSADLENWTDHGEILHSRDVSWGLDGFMWAPGAARKEGVYYLYYPHKDTSGTWRIGVATSQGPRGPFTDIGAPMEGITGIDPAIFIDDDNEAYLYNNSAVVARLKPNMIELAETPRKIDYDKTNRITDDYNEGFAEGSYMHKRNGIYYYSYTNWHNDRYQAFYAVGDNPYGPFEWKGPMAPKPKGAQDHHSVIEFQGQWYYFYHVAVQEYPENKEGQGRIACFDRLYYNKDGTIQTVVHTYGPTRILTTDAPNGFITPDPPGGAYAPGTQVTLTAQGDLGFAFNSWSGDLSGTDNPTTIVMDTDKVVAATFDTVPVYKLTWSAKNGSVLLDPPGGRYSSGTIVTLTAVDDFGYAFSSWSEDLSGSENPTHITMDGDKEVTANYVSVPVYQLSVHSENGLVTLDPPGGNYEEGEEVTLEAIPDFGYIFSGWSGDLSGMENPVIIPMDSDKDVTSSFSYEGGGKLVFATNCGGSGFRSGEGIDYIEDHNYSGGGTYSTGSEISGTMDDDLYRTERFGKNFGYDIPLPNNKYKVTLMFAEIFHADPGKRIFHVSLENTRVISNLDLYSVAGKNTPYGETFEVEVTDGTLDISFTAVTDNAKISAIKVVLPDPPTYTLSTVSSNGSIIVDPAREVFAEGTKVSLAAVPDTGYLFSQWGGDLSGSANPETITMDRDKNISATFVLLTGQEEAYRPGLAQTKLSQNYPNPFSMKTAIPYRLDSDSHVKLTIHNLFGQQVTTLVDEFQHAGSYCIEWYPQYIKGKKLENGLYVFRLETGDPSVDVKKSMLVH